MTRRALVSAICRAYRSGATVPRLSERFGVDEPYVYAALRARNVALRDTSPCEHPRLHAAGPCVACRVARDNALRAAQAAALAGTWRARKARERQEARLAGKPVTCGWCARVMLRAEAARDGGGWQCREGEGCAAPREGRAAA